MEAFIVSISSAFFGGMILTIALLNWYKKKEQTEARVLDLRVLAAEHNLSFQPVVNGFASRLRTNNIGLLLTTVEVKNIVSSRQSNQTVHFFDYNDLYKKQSNEVTPYSAIFVELDNQTLPAFSVSQKYFLDKTSSYYIEHNRLPRWVPKNLTVTAHADQHLAVSEILRENLMMKELISQPKFHKFILRGSYMIVYFKGSYEASSVGFNWMRLRVDEMLRINGATVGSAADDIEIHLLKQSEQANETNQVLN